MTKKIDLATRHFKHERVQEAVIQFKRALECLMPNEQTGDEEARKLLERHKTDLETDVKELRRLHKEAQKVSGAIRDKKLQLLSKQISILDRAINDIENTPRLVLQRLRRTAEKVVRAFNTTNGRPPFEGNGEVAHEYIEKMYGNSRADTKQRYEEMDFWYAIGNEYALRWPDAEDRAYEIALIPKPIQHAKWQFMLALSDVAYNITYHPEHAEEKGPIHNILLSRLLNRLSMHERGADNPHMPVTHKLRHNPAIHSLHTVALADKIFHQTRKEIERSTTGNGTVPKRLIEWRKLRDRVMLMALLHDMGEMDGELSQGIDRSRLTQPEIDALKHAVAEDEKATFLRHLERQRKSLRIDDATWANLQKEYISLFNDADNTGIFIGRFVKALERIQSQHDYLRFEGMGGAVLLREADEANRDFSLDYVSKILRDAPYNQKEYGKKSLMALAEQTENDDKKTVCGYLAEALEEEYEHLMEKLVPAYTGRSSYQRRVSNHSR